MVPEALAIMSNAFLDSSVVIKKSLPAAFLKLSPILADSAAETPNVLAISPLNLAVCSNKEIKPLTPDTIPVIKPVTIVKGSVKCLIILAPISFKPAPNILN